MASVSAFPITWVMCALASIATRMFSIGFRLAGTNPAAEGGGEESSVGRPASYVNSASEEFHLIARVLALSINRVIATGAAAD